MTLTLSNRYIKCQSARYHMYDGARAACVDICVPYDENFGARYSMSAIYDDDEECSARDMRGSYVNRLPYCIDMIWDVVSATIKQQQQPPPPAFRCMSRARTCNNPPSRRQFRQTDRLSDTHKHARTQGARGRMEDASTCV